ncbi:MAG: hypothetical protein ACR2LV_04370 [Solirubrobacteraceae bacterium]
MSRFRLLAATIGALAAASSVAAASAAPTTTSHAKLWQNPTGSVVCGLEIHLAGKPSKYLLCSAKGIPRPKHQGGVGDSFVQIAARGRPQLVLISQSSFEATRRAKLRRGTLWTARGISCHIGSSTVRCTNRSGHGFTIGNGSYRSLHVILTTISGGLQTHTTLLP